ncbi:unnamed protein product [Adineta ricciae]|uniref:Uncharacterized protein n=1 Tax=Adineta ricciae TaxID=249248 RepID=A0A814N3R1_ADIRI|nr:unnamed protein product [Adineta ricciae]CAF1150352.1 unnamed protein product [Adineta ricciae]
MSEHNTRKFTLVWLDSSVNVSEENLDTQVLFRKVNDQLRTFDKVDQCLEYIRMNPKEKLVLVVSGRLGQEILPRIQQFTNLIAVYVYCSDKKRNEEWANKYLLIKDVIVDLKILLEKIRADQVQRDEYEVDGRLSFSVFHPKSSRHTDSSMNSDAFFHFQLLIKYFSQVKPSDQGKHRFISLCKEKYHDDQSELNVISEFETKYSSTRAFWWFTRDCFLHQLLDQAFQSFDTDLLYHFHFFIRDMYDQLTETKRSSPTRTYRSQILSNDEIKSLESSIGGFLSINAFLSTVPDRNRALTMLKNRTVPDGSKQVLFEITADPTEHDAKPFSNITAWNYEHGTEVVLFMAGTIFHQIRISESESDNILVIRMEQCHDSHRKVKLIFDRYQSERSLLSFGHVLSRMKRFDEAQKYFEQTLQDMPHDYHSVACCYQGLGDIALKQENYDSSLKWYEKALETNQAVLRSEDPEIASSYSDLANVYLKKGELNQASQLYNQALQIWIRALGKEHSKVAGCYKNLARVFQSEERYSEALEYFKKALKIQEKHLPGDPFELAKLHNHIADVYVLQNEMNEAFQQYNSACNILIKNHSSTHPDVLLTLRNMGFVYEKLGNLNEALEYYKKIAAACQRLQFANHDNILQINQDIQRVSALLNVEVSNTVAFI